MLGNNEVAVCYQFPRMWGTGPVRLFAALRVVIGARAKSMSYGYSA